MARRHKLDILAEILNFAKNGVKKTKLVYQANSNFTVMKEYLQTLIDRGFIESIDGHLVTTDKGLEFLEKFEEMMAVFHSVVNGEPNH